MQKNEKEYSYMLRFRKDLPLDSQALKKITEFCDLTRMNKRDAVMMLLATANVQEVIDRILSATGLPADPSPEHSAVSVSDRTKPVDMVQVKPQETEKIEKTEKTADIPVEHAVKKEKRMVLPEEPEHPTENEMGVDVEQDAEKLLSAGNDSLLDDIFNNF